MCDVRQLCHNTIMKEYFRKKIKFDFLRSFKFWVIILLIINVIYLQNIGRRIGHLNPFDQQAWNEVQKEYPEDLSTGLYFALEKGLGNVFCSSPDDISALESEVSSLNEDIQEIKDNLKYTNICKY